MKFLSLCVHNNLLEFFKTSDYNSMQEKVYMSIPASGTKLWNP